MRMNCKKWKRSMVINRAVFGKRWEPNDYALRKLNKEYIEAIAGQWKRLNVETVKEAREICRKEHKKVSKNIVVKQKRETDTNLPEWFNKDFEKDSDKLDELADVLKEFE